MPKGDARIVIRDVPKVTVDTLKAGEHFKFDSEVLYVVLDSPDCILPNRQGGVFASTLETGRVCWFHHTKLVTPIRIRRIEAEITAP